MELDRNQIDAMVGRSLSLVTALSLVIGYDDDAHIAEAADRVGSSLRDAALKSGKPDAARFDAVVDPMYMIGDGIGGA